MLKSFKKYHEAVASGTLITESQSTTAEIKAIAAKDNITAIYIHSTRMLKAFAYICIVKYFLKFVKIKQPAEKLSTFRL